MNKSISISLGGLSFFIEEDAFQKLKKYLEEVENSLEVTEEDTAEILKDVEARIAELFKNWLGNYRQVVDLKDVDKMITIMGTPEQYKTGADEETIQADNLRANQLKEKEGRFYQRQLFRDMDDKIIAGVCSGVAHFIGVQPIWIRLVTILMMLFSGWILDGLAFTVFLTYIILWIVMPKALTTSDKLKMKGKPINFDSIKEYVNREDLSAQAGKIKTNFTKASSGIGQFFETFFNILLKVVTIVIGIFFVIAGMLLLISYLLFSFSISDYDVGSLQFFNLFFEYSWQLYAFLILSGIVILIPSFLVLLMGLRLITERKIINISLTVIITIFIIWLFSLIGAMALGIGNTNFQFVGDIQNLNKINIPVSYDI